MTIDDFEWEGEIESRPASGSVQSAGAPRRRAWLRALRQSVWFEPALRFGGLALLLGVLAGIGIVATTYAKPGVPLPEGPPRALAAVLGTSWLKPTPAVAADGIAQPAAPAAPPSAQVEDLDPPPAPSSAPSNPGGGLTADGKVVLNRATAEQLTRLPGVGMKRAEAIVALRTKLKRFRQVTDLLRVKGIGPRGLKRMLPHLVLDAPA